MPEITDEELMQYWAEATALADVLLPKGLEHSYLHYDSTYAGFVDGCEACEFLKKIESQEN